jgi:hypothetical protein
VEGSKMSDKELIQRIYDRCPNAEDRSYTIDQYFDRCQDIIDMIDAHQWDEWRQEEAGVDY